MVSPQVSSTKQEGFRIDGSRVRCDILPLDPEQKTLECFREVMGQANPPKAVLELIVAEIEAPAPPLCTACMLRAGWYRRFGRSWPTPRRS